MHMKSKPCMKTPAGFQPLVFASTCLNCMCACMAECDLSDSALIHQAAKGEDNNLCGDGSVQVLSTGVTQIRFAVASDSQVTAAMHEGLFPEYFFLDSKDTAAFLYFYRDLWLVCK